MDLNNIPRYVYYINALDYSSTIQLTIIKYSSNCWNVLYFVEFQTILQLVTTPQHSLIINIRVIQIVGILYLYNTH